MSYKLWLLLLIGLHSVSGKRSANRDHNKTATDAWIKKTLLSEKAKDCLKIESPLKQIKSNITRVSPKDFTWTVAILERIRTSTEIVDLLYCTGSLIQMKVVLAAAHCFQKKPTGDLTVLAGATADETIDSYKHHQRRHIDSIVFHENFTSDPVGNDIALIFLKEPFIINKDVHMVCMGFVGLKVEKVNTNCLLTTWNSKKRQAVGHPQFMKLNTTMVSNRQCQRVLRKTKLGKEFQMSSKSFCITGGLNNTEVWGNGGAPLVCQICDHEQHLIQVGLLSFGFEADPLPAVLTNVMDHQRWIRNTCSKRRIRIHSCLNQ